MKLWAPLREEVGHTYEDVQRFLNTGRENWGLELLMSLWADEEVRNSLRRVALIDLLFESMDRSTLYGFFAISKLLVAKSGESQIHVYQRILEQLFRHKKVTVGSHFVFKEGLPIGLNRDRQLSLLQTHESLEAAKRDGGIFSENYLWGSINVRARPLDTAINVDTIADLFDYGEVRPDMVVANSREFEQLKLEASCRDIEQHWREFLRDFESAFDNPSCVVPVPINMFAVPILTRDLSADRQATGALFFGEFA